MDHIEALTKSQLEYMLKSDSKTEIFTLNSRNILAKIVSVYDGDSCKANIYVGDVLSQFSLRLMGYDSPEIRTKNASEKECANISKACLQLLLLDKVVRLECLDFDKYGRVLANVYVRLKVLSGEGGCKELNVNNFMVKHRLGHPYFGDKKNSFDELFDKKYYTLGEKLNF